jgi:hypothetical protein
MVKKRKNKSMFWIFLTAFIWVLSLIGMIYTNILRTQSGIESYYSSAFLMTLGTISTSVFSATTLAIVIGLVVNRALKAVK